MITGADRRRINQFKQTHEHICFYCGKVINQFEDLTVDHLQPVSRGGRTIDKNLVICCKFCNAEKSNRTYDEYMQYLKTKHIKTKYIKHQIQQATPIKLNLTEEIIDIDQIKIPYLFQETPPKQCKIQKKEEYYRQTKKFLTYIILNKNNMLVDGYINYLILKKYGIKQIPYVNKNDFDRKEEELCLNL